MTAPGPTRFIAPFNGPVEIGLRALGILSEAFPRAFSLQRLVILDYLVVHSDDLTGGPIGLHPKTPHRGAELLVRRRTLQEGLLLFQSRGLVERRFATDGVFFVATDASARFLDALSAQYVRVLRERAGWLADRLDAVSDHDLEQQVRQQVGRWGAEFALESVLWADDAP